MTPRFYWGTGMVQSAWGGTEITSWIKNSSGACQNASGTGPQKTGGGGGPDFGALWNGMVAPFINSTIFGALWYQVRLGLLEHFDTHYYD